MTGSVGEETAATTAIDQAVFSAAQAEVLPKENRYWTCFVIALGIQVVALLLFEGTVLIWFRRTPDVASILFCNFMFLNSSRDLFYLPPVHELAGALKYLWPSEWSGGMSNFGLTFLALQMLFLGFLFARRCSKSHGIPASFLISFFIFSGFNSLILWMVAWWIGFLSEPVADTGISKRKPLFESGSLQNRGFMAYLIHGLIVQVAIMVPLGILCPLSIIIRSGSIAHPLDYASRFIIGASGFIALLANSIEQVVLSNTYFWPSRVFSMTGFGIYLNSVEAVFFRWRGASPGLGFVYGVAPFVLLSPAIALVFAANCQRRGCATKRLSRVLTRFTIANCGLMFVAYTLEYFINSDTSMGIF